MATLPFKDAPREIAAKVFPSYLEYFTRVKDHNTADAALLAAYAAMHYAENKENNRGANL